MPVISTNPGKVLAAFVTHNGAGSIRQTLASVAWQTRPVDACLVVDNASTDRTLQQLDVPGLPETEVHFMTKNVGLPAAHNLIMRKAAAGGYDWVWIFDQDSSCEPDCLEQLLACARASAEKGQMPAVLFPDISLAGHPEFKLVPVLWTGTGVRDAVFPEAPEVTFTEVHSSISSGSLYHVPQTAETRFTDDFFIDYSDHDFHLRLHQKGARMLWVSQARMAHGLGRAHSGTGGVSITHKPWRYYFIVRNMLLMHYDLGGVRAVFGALAYLKKQYGIVKAVQPDFDSARRYGLRGLLHAPVFKLGFRNIHTGILREAALISKNGDELK